MNKTFATLMGAVCFYLAHCSLLVNSNTCPTIFRMSVATGVLVGMGVSFLNYANELPIGAWKMFHRIGLFCAAVFTAIVLNRLAGCVAPYVIG